MPASTEQINLVTLDLMEAFQNKFGEDWRDNLTKNLRPSPLRAIAELRGVTLNEVKKARHRLWMVGIINQAMANAQTATEE